MARKILLADDSVTAQNMGRKILADAGYDVFTVNNGSAALKRISEVKPDLIVLDVYMPGYSGLEVCQRLKDAPETGHIPVLLTVGKLEPFKPDEARRVRADAHIVKPFEASELLTAITRLEDRMVPMADGSRFSNSVSGVERFNGDGGRKTESSDDTDTGWKSRLRFPSKKKKEEPEPEEIVPEATFRNYRKGKSGKSGPGPGITVKPPAPAGQEPGLVPDIPRDITPDELDALSALAAKLDGPIPPAENIAPVAEKVGPVETPATEIAKAPVEVAVPVAETPKEPAKQVEAPAAIAEFAVTPVSNPTPSAEVQTQVPVASATEVPAPEPAAQPAPVATAPTVVETAAAETPVASAASAAPPAQEPATIDRVDEPQPSEMAIAKPVTEPKIEPVAEAKAETKSEPEVNSPVAEVPATEVVAKTEPVAVVAQHEAKPEEDQKPEEAKGSAPTEEAAQAKIPEPESLKPESEALKPAESTAAEEPKVESEEPAPSEEELAEALRLLTPATGSADVTTIPSHGTLVAAGQLLAEEVARNAAAGPRWVAESVALSPEEAALSLEDEMFRTFATTPAAVPGATRGDEGQRTGITGVSAIAAAVENRLAEADKIASVSSTVSSATAPAIDAAVPAQSEAVVAAEKNETASAAKVSEEPAEEAASATFADAISATQAVESEAATASAHAIVEAESQDSSSDSGGDEAMGKDGKSTWRQIRTAPAGAGSNADAVEAAKTEAANEAPKAMAAAAAADGSASGASDAASIASIVDSVMADLRPKIVEEIAKKLAGK